MLISRGLYTVLLAATLAVAPRTEAQAPRRSWNGIIGASGIGYGSSGPDGGPGGIGLALGVQRAIAPQVGVRVASQFVWTLFGSPAPVCHPVPSGACRGPSVVPKYILQSSIVAVVRPIRAFPLDVVGGAAIVTPLGPREYRAPFAVVDSTSRSRGSLIGGLELSLGRSYRAPRVFASRTHLLKDSWSLSSLTMVGFVFPF